MIFPVVGTIVGGVLGALEGRGIASTAKQRYLVRAQEHAIRVFGVLARVSGMPRCPPRMSCGSRARSVGLVDTHVRT